MIIWLASYPRSGNTFFRVLLNHHYGIHTYSIYDDRLLTRRRADWEIVGHLARPVPIPDMIESKQTFLVKTHDLPQDNLPAIYLVRDGRDALVSYAHYVLTFEQQENTQATFHHTLHDLIVYNNSFGGWGPNVLAWAQRDAPAAIVRFEDLVDSSKPFTILQNALENLGYVNYLPVVTEEPPSFQELHKQMPNFFRKGKIGGWREEMSTDLHALFWEKHGEAMELMGYSR